VSPAAFGFNVTVEVTNVSTRPIVLQLSPNPAGHPRLQSLTVEQWDANLGWQPNLNVRAKRFCLNQ
jgi:hypothetical protein